MEKIFNARTYPVIAVVLVGIISFFLGGLLVYSVYNSAKGSPEITLAPLEVDTPVSRRVYVSIHGKRYYPWWCDAGSKIAKENIVWYDTPEEAKGRGYTIAKGCQ